MDINTLRGIFTLLSMVAFVGICIWAWSRKRKKSFTEAAHLPFADEEMARRSGERREGK